MNRYQKLFTVLSFALLLLPGFHTQAEPVRAPDDEPKFTIMINYIPFQSVLELIQENNFGTYKLLDAASNTLIAGSHIASDNGKEDQKMEAAELIQHLERNVERLGSNRRYKVLLKKGTKHNSINEVTYCFEINDQPAAQQNGIQLQGMGSAPGFSYEQMRGEIERESKKELDREREKFEYEKKMWELEKKIDDLKAKKTVDVPGLQGLVDVGKMITAAVIHKHMPEAMPTVEAMMGVEEVEDSQEDFPQSVERTD